MVMMLNFKMYSCKIDEQVNKITTNTIAFGILFYSQFTKCDVVTVDTAISVKAKNCSFIAYYMYT